MNTNELRIGNWLYGYDPISDSLKPSRYFQVQNIDDERINVWRVEGFSDENANGEPVPLTPEILKACGFTERQQAFFWYYSINYIHVAVERKFELQYLDEKTYAWIEGNTIVHVSYLHELQNLFFPITKTELIYRVN